MRQKQITPEQALKIMSPDEFVYTFVVKTGPRFGNYTSKESITKKIQDTKNTIEISEEELIKEGYGFKLTTLFEGTMYVQTDADQFNNYFPE